MTEPEAVIEVVTEAEDQEDHLTPEESNEFLTLIQVGARSKYINVYGHKIKIQTLSIEDDLNVGLLVKPYLESTSVNRAYRAAICAAAIKEIDGKRFMDSLGPFEESDLPQRFERMKKYYPPVVDEIYKEFTELEKELASVLSRLGKL